MIFSSNWANFDDDNISGLIPCNGHVICVYQGIQPSITEYITNYDSAYNLSSPDILQVITYYNQGWWQNSGGSFIETDPDALYYTQALKSFRPGTATWASVSKVGNFVTNQDPAGYYFLSDSEVSTLNQSISYIINNGRYEKAPSGLRSGLGGGFVSIVPVTDMNDNGVIKFRSIEFSDPDGTDEDRAIDMSVTISKVDQE